MKVSAGAVNLQLIHMNIDQEKEKIRKAMRAEIAAQTEKERLNKSNLVAAKLRKIGSFEQAKTILFYYATDREVATKELILEAIQKKKKVALPYMNKNSSTIHAAFVTNIESDLVRGDYRIMEPKPEIRTEIAANEIDLVIVPGLAFDQAKYRLGQGKGFYDRFLSKLPRHVITIGLAFDFQVVEALPVTELDFPVSRVVHN